MSIRVEKAHDVTVVIPAAGRVPEGVLALSNITCPAMIPVAGRPVVYWTMSYLRSLGLRRFVIAVARRGMFVEDFVECTFGHDCDLTFLVPSVDGGVGFTVKELVEHVKTSAVLVVLGDTHFQFADPAVLEGEEPFVLVGQVEESYRWCVADVDADGRVSGLHDKQRDRPAPLDALIGVYHFPDVEVVRQAARDAVASAEETSSRVELAAILSRVRARTPIRAIRAGDWLDCGNPDRQASSHRSLLQQREFNELSIDPVLGTITKRSRYVEKLIDEINFLRLLPADLCVLFPRILDYSTRWEDPWITMEYYGYPTLAEVFVFENADPAIWEQVFTHLYEIMTGGLMRRRRPISSSTLRAMYIEKTRERLEQTTATGELLALIQHRGHLNVNGREVMNLPLLWERLETEVAGLSANVEGAIIHGDLCLSNILYDLRSRICKLVDPRGSFGAAGLFGDPRYDVAKLYHSVYGLYDFIVNDLFHLRVEGRSVHLEIRSRAQHGQIQQRFEKVFFGRFDRREIVLLTGLLFASMLPLHNSPARQTAMYVRALELLDEALSLPVSLG